MKTSNLKLLIICFVLLTGRVDIGVRSDANGYFGGALLRHL